MVSAEVLHWVSSVPVGLIICFLGLAGNAVSIFVWYKILKKRLDRGSSTGLFLIVLGVVDSLLLVFFMLIESPKSAKASFVSSYAYSFFYSYIGFPFYYFFIVSSIWLLVAVTFDRCVIVSAPTKARNLCSVSRTLVSISITLVCAFIVNIPNFFNYSPKAVNGTYAVMETEYGRNEGAKGYDFWVHCMVLVLVPWVSITVMNVRIIWSIRKRVKKSIELFPCGQEKIFRERKKKQDQVTWMLLSVSCTFLLLLSAQCITQCLWMLLYGSKKPTWNTVDKSFAFAKLGIPINSAINWLLYCATGSEFRKEMLRFAGFNPTNSIVPSKDEAKSTTQLSMTIPDKSPQLQV